MAIVHPTAENFDALIRDNKLVLVDFFATRFAGFLCGLVRPVQNDRTVH